MKTIKLKFDGYWGEKNISSISKGSGVYVVYQGKYNQQKKLGTLERILYIGESANVNDRIKNHEKWPKWRKECANGKGIWFSFTPVANPDRERGEAALIFKHKPPVNTEYVDAFPFEDTRVISSGECAILTKDFTVQKTE